ncbi:unnamed protein product [Arctia plantaginis]|uniref:Uncharacterized protein n=1 Tax=Arctia plantaginis TaxID=874455 RepID=A0A8S1B2V1_ARCPL|nr:unnamed protein product [Arctia plantaginis]
MCVDEMCVMCVCDVAGGAGSVNALPSGAGARLAPSFDAATPRNVTALVGKSAYLSCRVRNLGNRTVTALSSNTHKPPQKFLARPIAIRSTCTKHRRCGGRDPRLRLIARDNCATVASCRFACRRSFRSASSGERKERVTDHEFHMVL